MQQIVVDPKTFPDQKSAVDPKSFPDQTVAASTSNTESKSIWSKIFNWGNTGIFSPEQVTNFAKQQWPGQYGLASTFAPNLTKIDTDLASGMTSPINIGMTALTGGENLAADAGMPLVTKGLTIARRLASIPYAIHGANTALDESQSGVNRTLGGLESIGGIIGVGARSPKIDLSGGLPEIKLGPEVPTINDKSRLLPAIGETSPENVPPRFVGGPKGMRDVTNPGITEITPSDLKQPGTTINQRDLFPEGDIATLGGPKKTSPSSFIPNRRSINRLIGEGTNPPRTWNDIRNRASEIIGDDAKTLPPEELLKRIQLARNLKNPTDPAGYLSNSIGRTMREGEDIFGSTPENSAVFPMNGERIRAKYGMEPSEAVKAGLVIKEESPDFGIVYRVKNDILKNVGSGSTIKKLYAGLDPESMNLNDKQKQFASVMPRFIDALFNAKQLRGVQEESYSAEKAKRVGELASITDPGLSGYYKKLGAMKGEYGKVRSEPLQLSASETDQLMAVVHHSDMMPLQKLNAQGGLAKILAGQVPTNSELKLLTDAFGGDPQMVELFGGLGMLPSKHALTEIGNISKTLSASIDISAAFRQGLGAIGSKAYWQNYLVD